MLNSDGSLFRVVEKNCFCAATRIADCDKDQINIQVLSAVPGTGFNYDKKPENALRVARFLNDHIAGVVTEGQGRFIALGTVPMQQVDMAIAELNRCVLDMRKVPG